MTLESSLADDLRMLALLLVQDDETAVAAVLLTAMADALCG